MYKLHWIRERIVLPRHFLDVGLMAYICITSSDRSAHICVYKSVVFGIFKRGERRYRRGEEQLRRGSDNWEGVRVDWERARDDCGWGRRESCARKVEKPGRGSVDWDDWDFVDIQFTPFKTSPPRHKQIATKQWGVIQNRGALGRDGERSHVNGERTLVNGGRTHLNGRLVDRISVA